LAQISYIEDFEVWKQEFSFYIPIRVRFSETDMFGHVNNISPFIYFEEGRIAFFDEIGLYKDMTEKTQVVPVVGDLQCNYLKQIFFGDSLKLYVKIKDLGTTSFDVHYMIVNQQEDICITGRGRIVQINIHTGKPVEFDQHQCTLLEKVLS
jgi:acyl-CoA thioester hydrolase